MKTIKRIWPWVFIISLLAMGLLTYVLPDKEMSLNENRYLAKKPKISFGKIISAKAQEEISDYLQDQFPMREDILTALTAMKKSIGVKDIGGVYIGKDGYYFTKTLDKDMDLSNYEKNLNRIESFAKSNEEARIYFMPVPSKGNILKELLPANAKMYDDGGLYEMAKGKSFQLVDLRGILKNNNNEYIYYKTDHHWTTLGAYFGFEALSGETHHWDFRFHQFSNAFRGTLYSKTMDTSAPFDKVDIIDVPKTEVTADGKAIQLYDQKAAKTKDKYQVFLGGNYGFVSIINKEPREGAKGRKILLVKDSFANAMVPFLLQNYEEIYMVDLRYYSGPITQMVKEKNIKDVVFIYEMSSFAATKDLAKLALDN